MYALPRGARRRTLDPLTAGMCVCVVHIRPFFLPVAPQLINHGAMMTITCNGKRFSVTFFVFIFGQQQATVPWFSGCAWVATNMFTVFFQIATAVLNWY